MRKIQAQMKYQILNVQQDNNFKAGKFDNIIEINREQYHRQMENSLICQYSSEGKLMLRHLNCRYWTKVEITKILILLLTQMNNEGNNDLVIQYPCCGLKESIYQLYDQIANVCLYCQTTQKYLQSGSRILLKYKSHTICQGCFEDLKDKSQNESVEPESLEFIFIKALHRCCQCKKIVGFQNDIQKNGNEIFCVKCNQQMEDEIERQSAIDQSMNKTSRSLRSLRSFFEQEYLSFPKNQTSPIEKPQPTINHVFPNNFIFDRSQYERKDKSELINIIESLSLRIQKLQQQKLSQRLMQSSVNSQGELKMLKMNRSFISDKQPELNQPKNGTKIKITSPVYQATRIPKQMIESRGHKFFKNEMEASQQINNSETFQNNMDKQKIQNQSIGESRFAQQTALYIDKSYRDRKEDEMYLQEQNQKQITKNSCHNTQRASNELQLELRQVTKSNLNSSAPVNSTLKTSNSSYVYLRLSLQDQIS